MESLLSNHKILVVTEDNENINTIVNDLKNKTENVTSINCQDVLNLTEPSSYDFIISRLLLPKNHDGSLLPVLLKLAKPGAKLIFREQPDATNQLMSQLKINGFINISDPKTISDDKNLSEIICCKPNFEVGSSAQLNLKPKSTVSKVWKLDDTVDDEVETIDPDNLLDEDDFKKPDAPLRVCNTTGKRKACKDCSCGLADEIAAEKGENVVTADMPKSSCGSCYLGDAFRCASCPYLGMPAFKPGEKIQLSADQLKADL